MSTYAEDSYKFDAMHHYKAAITMADEVVFGTAAIASQTATDPQIAVTRTGVGTYTMTYPAGAKCIIKFTVLSVALTVDSCVLTAKSATAGTAGFTLTKGGTATEPLTGDHLDIEITIEGRAT